MLFSDAADASKRQRLTEREATQKSPLALAFLGDAVWDLLVRGQLIASGEKARALHAHAIERVNAGAQARALERIRPALSEAEEAIVRRGENAHAHHDAPKHQTQIDYSRATGLEALFGYLYATAQEERLTELFERSQA